MANVNRDLPNVYTTLNDMSALIEGEDSLIVGVTLRSNRGPMNVASNITDSSDFLTRYTFTGKPGVKQERLQETSMYHVQLITHCTAV